ncbi:hypothetical protein ES703_80482 [subsurface metagenome]
MIFVFGGQITFLYRAGNFTFGMKQSHCNMLYILQAGIDTNRLGLQAGYLKAVILGRVMRGCNLDAAAGAQMIDCKIHLRRINHSNINHIYTGGINSFYKGPCYRFAVRSHIPTDAQCVSIGLASLIAAKQRRQKSCCGTADFPCIFFVNLVGVNAPYIVRLENCRIHPGDFLNCVSNSPDTIYRWWLECQQGMDNKAGWP